MATSFPMTDSWDGRRRLSGGREFVFHDGGQATAG